MLSALRVDHPGVDLYKWAECPVCWIVLRAFAPAAKVGFPPVIVCSAESLTRANSDGHGVIEPIESLFSTEIAADHLTRTEVDRD